MKTVTTNSTVATTSAWAPLPLRIALGLVFLTHGSQKLFGWFGGGGIEGTGQFFASSLGLAPGVLWATIAGVAEFFGGLAVLIGFYTRVGAAALAAVMAGAIAMVHRGGFFASEGGMEYALTLLMVAISLLIMGGGQASVDAKLKRA